MSTGVQDNAPRDSQGLNHLNSSQPAACHHWQSPLLPVLLPLCCLSCSTCERKAKFSLHCTPYLWLTSRPWCCQYAGVPEQRSLLAMCLCQLPAELHHVMCRHSCSSRTAGPGLQQLHLGTRSLFSWTPSAAWPAAAYGQTCMGGHWPQLMFTPCPCPPDLWPLAPSEASGPLMPAVGTIHQMSLSV